MDDGGPSSPASYIRLVQHLIEKCICYYMNKEECMETLEKHANIKPVITSTVWKELEKENQEFFETYQKDRGEESTHKNPSDEQPSASKSSSEDDHDHDVDDENIDDGNYQKDRGQESTHKNPSDDEQALVPRAHQKTTTTTATITTTTATRTLARPTPASVTLARPTPPSVRSRSSSDDDHGDNNNDGN